MRLFKVLIVACLMLGSTATLNAVVVLSEIMFDPDGEESSDEFIEIFNDSAFPLELAGWRVSDGGGADTVVSAGMGTLVLPHQYALILDPDYITDGSTTYDTLVPETALVVTISGNTFGSRGLANGESEPVELSNAQGQVIARCEYSVGNSEGHSDEKARLDGGDEFANWQDSRVVHGTPGFRNSVTPFDRDLRIRNLSVTPQRPDTGQPYVLTVDVVNSGLLELSNTLLLSHDSSLTGAWDVAAELPVHALSAGDSAEFEHDFVLPGTGVEFVRAELLDPDENQENNSATLLVSSEGSAQGLAFNEIQYDPLAGRSEWIELAVSGPIPVSLSGLFVSDGQGILDSARRIPLPELVLSPGDYLIVAMDSSIIFENLPTNAIIHVLDSIVPTLNNGGDSLALWSSAGEMIARLDYRSNWGNEQSGVSLERISLVADGNDRVNWGASVDPSGSTPGRENSLALATSPTANSLSASPSPFTPNGDGDRDVTEIHYRLELAGDGIDLRLFDALGRQVRRLSGNASAAQGSVIWDGRDDRGELLPTGRYIILLETTGDGRGGVAREKTTVILARPR